MATKKKMLQAAAGSATGGAALDITDVFSTYLYDGTGSAQTITNDIDLDGEGGLVWLKERTSVGALGWHSLFDTERGTSKYLSSNNTNAEASSAGVTAFNSNGFTLGTTNLVNQNTGDFASWTFRKAPKFFDVVTYTGVDAPQTISHNLGSVPACIIVKRTDTTGDWAVYHRGVDATSPQNYWLKLNNTDAREDYDMWDDTAPTQTEFSVRLSSTVNEGGGTYVAYLFAHNDGDGEFGPDGDQDIIKCGSYTGNGSTDGPEIDLGFEPQWVMFKQTDATGNWRMFDTMRGWTVGNGEQELYPNLSLQEYAVSERFSPQSTGFKVTSSDPVFNNSGSNYIYMAIRRGPLAQPESGTEVFSPNLASGYPRYPSGFATDFVIQKSRSSGSGSAYSRLQGNNNLDPSTTAQESASAWDWAQMTGSGTNFTSTNYIGWNWKRAPGFFDVVAYTGNATAGRTVPHNLGVAPELMIAKTRDAANYWVTYDAASGPTKFMILNQTNGTQTSIDHWNNTAPTASVFTLGDGNYTNRNATQHIIYLFASLDGISKVGSFTISSGQSSVVDCGFSSGARFVLMKRYDGSDYWWVFDTERGITVSSSPGLRLDTTLAESSDTYLTPNSTGFATVAGYFAAGDYIFYAIA